MSYRLSDRSPEFQRRWNEVFSSEWGIWNLATLLRGGGGRKKPNGEVVNDETMFRERKSKGEYRMAEGIVWQAQCIKCRIGEPDGCGGVFCPEKNQEFHGSDASHPRHCNNFQKREDEEDMSSVEKIDAIPEEPKRKKTMAEIAAMGREALRKKREEAKKGILEKVSEKRAKVGGNGKTSKPLAAPPSPTESAFAILKRPKFQKLREILGSFTVNELRDAGGLLLFTKVFELMQALDEAKEAAA